MKRKLTGETIVNVGKRGLTPQLIEEIKKRLKSRGRVKIRLNKNIIRAGADVDDVAQKLSKTTGAHIVDVRGHTIILEKIEETQKS